MTTPIKKLMLAMAAAFALCLGARAASNDWMVVDIKTGEIFYHDYDFATATNTFSAPVYKTGEATGSDMVTTVNYHTSGSL